MVVDRLIPFARRRSEERAAWRVLSLAVADRIEAVDLRIHGVWARAETPEGFAFRMSISSLITPSCPRTTDELRRRLPRAVDARADESVETAADVEARHRRGRLSRRVTFADLGLPEGVVRKLAQNGVTTPFPIQAATIPDALAGKDILGRGRTGSGKTLSFGLPLLARWPAAAPRRSARAASSSRPTRELAMQVADALQPYGDVLGLKMKVVCGGTSMGNQIYALERGVDILVATPGRLRDLINRGACSLENVEVAVLDEADQMSDLGFLPEVTELLDQVPGGRPADAVLRHHGERDRHAGQALPDATRSRHEVDAPRARSRP